ncbi:hypothetical protein CMO91_06210 [Candidatus Woesearchaeota archaeon]|nr:hypothetical protein [Candidatus Woesearchaeota archaeon]|tara:strand:- start:851 stop:1495 length:645 start_codon:yes stop_codon:yes gene_type:complete
MSNLLFVGLGNPDARYAGTRHNFGADTIRAWVETMRSQVEVTQWQADSKAQADVAQVRLSSLQHTDQQGSSAVSRFLVLLRPATSDTITIHCVVPTTGMNKSGDAVAAYLNQHPLENHDVTLVHDDLELALGQQRYVAGGSARGHNGVRSIHTRLNDQNIGRLRLGIGRPEGEMPVDKYVLSKFTSEEQQVANTVMQQAGLQLTRIAQRPSPLT